MSQRRELLKPFGRGSKPSPVRRKDLLPLSSGIIWFSLSPLLWSAIWRSWWKGAKLHWDLRACDWKPKYRVPDPGSSTHDLYVTHSPWPLSFAVPPIVLLKNDHFYAEPTAINRNRNSCLPVPPANSFPDPSVNGQVLGDKEVSAFNR